MKKFEMMTKYIKMINNDGIGEWIFDKENDGTLEHPKQMPYVSYTDMVYDFIDDIYRFSEENDDYHLNCYQDILNENGIEWGQKSMTNADVESLDAQAVLALIMGAVRAERFCEGILISYFKRGLILKWLNRLAEIDNE